MSHSSLSTLIESIINGMSGTNVFLRATDDEANVQLHDISVSGKRIFIWDNLATLEGTGGNAPIKTWPIRINILKMAEVDGTTVEADSIRDELEPLADEIFDKMSMNALASSLVDIKGYQIEFAESVEVLDQILTGLTLVFDFPIDRSQNYCP